MESRLPPAVLVALGLASACEPERGPRASLARTVAPDTSETGDTSDTGDTGDTADTSDTGVGPCLSVQACLCTCEDPKAATALLPLAALAALAARRRRDARVRARAEVIEGLETAGALPQDVIERLKR